MTHQEEPCSSHQQLQACSLQTHLQRTGFCIFVEHRMKVQCIARASACQHVYTKQKTLACMLTKAQVAPPAPPSLSKFRQGGPMCTIHVQIDAESPNINLFGDSFSAIKVHLFWGTVLQRCVPLNVIVCVFFVHVHPRCSVLCRCAAEITQFILFADNQHVFRFDVSVCNRRNTIVHRLHTMTRIFEDFQSLCFCESVDHPFVHLVNHVPCYSCMCIPSMSA